MAEKQLPKDCQGMTIGFDDHVAYAAIGSIRNNRPVLRHGHVYGMKFDPTKRAGRQFLVQIESESSRGGVDRMSTRRLECLIVVDKDCVQQEI